MNSGNTIKQIKDIIAKCHSNGKIEKKSKDEINYLYHQAELQIISLRDQLDISFKPQAHAIMQELKDNYDKYKDYLTGGDLMLSKFKNVDDRYFKEHNTEYSKIETHLKTIIHKIHKL